MKKKSMLYLMNVDWNWIKQRPHFLAEELQKCGYNLTVLYRHQYKRRHYQKRSYGELNVKPYFLVPKVDRLPQTKWINDLLTKAIMCFWIAVKKPSHIFLTFPTQIKALPRKTKATIIYDCMDNHKVFIKKESLRSELVALEAEACRRAGNILVSSEYLRTELIKNYGQELSGKISVVRNGYNGQVYETVNRTGSSDKLKLCYIGTLAQWFDMKLILASLDGISDIEYHFYGPVDNIQIPENENIIYHGTIEHDQLFDVTADMDVFIMPFVINELTEAVDPVKLYEYINFGKNIISPLYKEIQRFENFVLFYGSEVEYLAVIEKLKADNSRKYTDEEKTVFLKNNTWQKRALCIKQLIETTEG